MLEPPDRIYSKIEFFVSFSYNFLNWLLDGCKNCRSTGLLKRFYVEMSKFIDKLNQISQTTPQPMGFRATQPVSPKPKILLIASLAQAKADSMVDYVTGADAVLFHISKLSSGVKALQKMRQVASDIPWGVWLKNTGTEKIKQMAEAGCDFIVFPAANTPLATLQDEDMGRILEVEPSLSEGLLRVVNELPVNAVLIASDQEEGYSLTWHHLMLFQRFAALLTKPLLATIPSNVTGNELQVLWKAGVDGVVVEVEVEQPTERLKELRRLIDKLTFPSPRKQGKVEALLPRIAEETSPLTEEEEEEE